MTGLQWVLLLFSLPAALIAWMLLARLRLVIDTRSGVYAVSWQGIAWVRMVEEGRIRFWLLGWSRTIDPWSRPGRVRKEKKQPKTPKKRTSRWHPSFRTVRRKAMAVLRSFRVRRFNCELDTDNYLTNAYLYPVFGLLSGPNRRLEINFTGEVALQIEIENRLYRILLALLK